MSILIGNAIFLFVLYMIYKNVEDRHHKSLQEQSNNLQAVHEELKSFKESFYRLKEEKFLLEKELEKYKNLKDAIDKRKKESKEIKPFPPDDLIAF
jgi:hypothetical protein